MKSPIIQVNSRTYELVRALFILLTSFYAKNLIDIHFNFLIRIVFLIYFAQAIPLCSPYKRTFQTRIKISCSVHSSLFFQQSLQSVLLIKLIFSSSRGATFGWSFITDLKDWNSLAKSDLREVSIFFSRFVILLIIASSSIYFQLNS